MQIQLDLFEEEKSDLDYLKEEIKIVQESNDRVRKSLFARHAELSKKYLELYERIEFVEKLVQS